MILLCLIFLVSLSNDLLELLWKAAVAITPEIYNDGRWKVCVGYSVTSLTFIWTDERSA